MSENLGKCYLILSFVLLSKWRGNGTAYATRVETYSVATTESDFTHETFIDSRDEGSMNKGP